MQLSILIIDSPTTLDATGNFIKQHTDSTKVEIFMLENADLALHFLENKKVNVPLVILGPSLQQPLLAARQLHAQAANAHLVFLLNEANPELITQLNSPVARVGRQWKTIALTQDDSAGKLKAAIKAARQYQQYRSTVNGVNIKLASNSSASDLVALQRFAVSVRFLANILEYANDAIIATTRDGIVVKWNRAAEKLFEIDSDNALSRSIDTLIDGRLAQKICPLLDNLIASDKVHQSHEIDCYRSDQQALYLELTLSKIFDEHSDHAIGVSIFVRDISSRKKAEITMRRLHEDLKKLSFLDGLTGVANRRKFDTTLDSEWKRAIRHQTPISLLMIDVDFFKGYNDFYGHQQGDECLKSIAKQLQSVAKRSTDLAARYGGEEFVLLLPETDEAEAIELADAFRKSVQELKIPNQSSDISENVTVSIGACTLTPTLNSESHFLLQNADKMLYCAKKKGRNCIEH